MDKPTIQDIRTTNTAHKETLEWLYLEGTDNDIDAGILHRDILLREIDRLEGELEKANEKPIAMLKAVAAGSERCDMCGAPATCLGAYESEDNLGFACDTCCGHGNEDGWCVRLKLKAELSAERDELKRIAKRDETVTQQWRDLEASLERELFDARKIISDLRVEAVSRVEARERVATTIAEALQAEREGIKVALRSIKAPQLWTGSWPRAMEWVCQNIDRRPE